MRLTARITAVLLFGVLLLIAVDQYLILCHENDEMTRDMHGDASHLAAAITQIVDDVWQRGGPGEAMRTLDELNQLGGRANVRVVYFDVTQGHADAPATSDLEYGRLNQVVSQYYRDPNGREMLCTYARLTVDTRPAAIELSEPIEHEDRNTTYFVLHALALIGITALLGAVGAVVIGGNWVGRPLHQLIAKTRRIGAGDLSQPLELNRSDEFGELAVALNSMCDQLRAAQSKIDREAQARMAALEQLRHADRLRTVGRLAAGIAHELGTPLNVISGRAALIVGQRLDEEAIRASATTIKSEADRIATIIRQLLDFARRNTPQRKCVDLPSLMRSTIQLLEPIAEKRGSQIQLQQCPPQLAVQVDAGQIQQVLTNLIVNGLESMPQGGQVEVSIEQASGTCPEQPAGPSVPGVRIVIADHGEGIAAEIREQIFEPFFTTKDVGEGTGLGLSIAYGIVQEHGGWIEVTSEPGQGSEFCVFLPSENAPCAAVS